MSQIMKFVSVAILAASIVPLSAHARTSDVSQGYRAQYVLVSTSDNVRPAFPLGRSGENPHGQTQIVTLSVAPSDEIANSISHNIGNGG